MKVLFIYPTFESLGIEYLSTVLKEGGHEIELLLDACLFKDRIMHNDRLANYFDEFEHIVAQAVAIRPDLVCFSVTTDIQTFAERYSKRLKKKLDVPVVWGGVHASVCPQDVLEQEWVDFVVQGEGEYALLDLVNALQDGRLVNGIPNIWTKQGNDFVGNKPRPLIRELDALPFPDKSIYGAVRTDFSRGYRTMASRGCPFSCHYCYNCFLKKLYGDEAGLWRIRSVENVIQEIRQAHERRPFRYVVFDDEMFPTSLEWLEKFVALYKQEIGLPFSCFIHPLTIDEHKMALLEEAGCSSVLMGLDTTDKTFNQEMCGRNVSAEDIARAVDTIRRTKVSLTGGYIIGFPNRSLKAVVDDLRFYNDHRPDALNVHWIRYFPGTLVREKLQAQGELSVRQIQQKEKKAISCRLRDDLSDHKDLASAANLFYLVCFLPKGLVRLLIDKVLTRFPKSLYWGGRWVSSFYGILQNQKNIVMSLLGLKRRNVRFCERRGFYIFHMFKVFKQKVRSRR